MNTGSQYGEKQIGPTHRSPTTKQKPLKQKKLTQMNFKGPKQRKCADKKSKEANEGNKEMNGQYTFTKTNECDSKWIGEGAETKHKSTTRFWLQNPNGVKVHSNFKFFRYDLEHMRQLKVDFVSLPESRINNSNAYVRTNLKYTIEKALSGMSLKYIEHPRFWK